MVLQHQSDLTGVTVVHIIQDKDSPDSQCSGRHPSDSVRVSSVDRNISDAE